MLDLIYHMTLKLITFFGMKTLFLFYMGHCYGRHFIMLPKSVISILKCGVKSLPEAKSYGPPRKKTVFGVSDKLKFKPVSSATEIS